MIKLMAILVYSATLLFALAACGTDNDVNVDGGTSNEVKAEVNYNADICKDRRFTPEQKLECIRLLTNPEVEATIVSDSLTQEQIDELLGVE